jgi:alanine-synthesizing transaminase
MFSRRTDWNAPLNRLTLTLETRRRSGAGILDLTQSNPTRAALQYPDNALAAAMARAAPARYEPDPLGLRSARETIAAHLSSAADPVSAESIVITASTSEAYSFLFKLLTDPGDNVIIERPGYPLLEHLAQLEMVELRPMELEFHRRWELDPSRLEAAIDDRTRAVVLVHPNNPTGSYLQTGEMREVQRIAAGAGIAVISDEVFYDFPLNEDPRRAPTATFASQALTFSLGGLSKSCGLPHYKLGWMRISGPEDQRRKALSALELIADNFLSVSTPVQAALPELLAIGNGIGDSIRARTRANLVSLRAVLEGNPALQLLPVEGGWSVVIRAPRRESDEEFVVGLVNASGVLVHPGYFFDFPGEGYFVVSLLTPPDTLTEGIRRIRAALSS